MPRFYTLCSLQTISTLAVVVTKYYITTCRGLHVQAHEILLPTVNIIVFVDSLDIYIDILSSIFTWMYIMPLMFGINSRSAIFCKDWLCV